MHEKSTAPTPVPNKTRFTAQKSNYATQQQNPNHSKSQTLQHTQISQPQKPLAQPKQTLSHARAISTKLTKLNQQIIDRRVVLTRGLAADVSEEGGDLHHLHRLVPGGAEPFRLKKRGGGDEGVVVPKSDRVRHRRVPLGEQILELVGLEIIGNGEVTTVN